MCQHHKTFRSSAFSFLYEPLTPTEAQEAFVGPLEHIGISYEPELVEVVIHDLVSEDGEIAPPHIQIVGEALYTRMRNRLAQREGPEGLTLADYQGLRGAKTIIREHLVRMVGSPWVQNIKRVGKFSCAWLEAITVA